MSGWSLVMSSARRSKMLAFTMAGLLGLFQFLLCLVARTAEDSNAFGQLVSLVPDFLRQLLGPSLIAMMSFSGIVCIGYFHIAVMGALIGFVISMGTEPAGEIELGFVDLVMSRPIPRHWLVTRSAILILGWTGLLLCSMVLGSTVGLLCFARQDQLIHSLKMIRSLVPNLAALMGCWGGLSLAVASFSRRRSIAGALVGIFALSTYLFDYIARVWQPAAGAAGFFPFHYYSGLSLITHVGIPWRDTGILCGYAIFGTLAAYAQIERRDL